MKNQSILLAIVFLLFGYNSIAQDSNDEYPASSKGITISIGNDSIAAYAMLASGNEKKETILLLHGRPGNERNLDLAQELRRKGRNVIYFNYRGAWGSQGEFLYSNCLEDVKHVMDFFSTEENSEKYKVNPESFILFGHSMGGGIALISGAKDERINKIAVYSPANLGWAFQKFNAERIEAYRMKLKSQFMLNVNPQHFIDDIRANTEAYNILNYRSQLIKKSILILDENERNKEWIEELENAEYILMKTDHSFSDKRLELIETVSEWVNN
jgi:pimeloyl-ACP methyl ester carboxylesterase